MEAMDTKPLNLNLEKNLIERIKIQAIKDGCSVSEITAGLYREYLKRSEKEKTK
jgi:hypothetical protein